MDDTKPTNQTTPPEESKAEVKTTPDEAKLQADLTKAAAEVEGVTVEDVEAEETKKEEIQTVEDSKVESTDKKEAPVVEEHAISETDAKKFAGQGDFALPVSPLDDLIGKPAGAAVNPEVKTEIPEGLPAEKKEAPLSQGSEGQASKKTEEKEEVKKESEEKKVEAQPQPIPEKKAEVQQPVPEKNVASTPMPVSKSSMKDLEKQAAGMLKQLDDKGKKADKKDENGTKEAKPKKKRSRAVTSMALAAVLVVMMGAGGIVGMNLLKIQQVADQRSQASEDCHCPVMVDGKEVCFQGISQCSEGASNCQGDSGYRCECRLACYENGVPQTYWYCDIPDNTCLGDNEGSAATYFSCESSDGRCTTTTGTYTWFECDGKTLDETSDGCQDEKVAGPESRTSGCFLDPASGWCGVQQMDVLISSTSSCFMSREIPCTSTPPTTEPSTPQCNDSCNTNDDCPSQYPCIGGFCRNSACSGETDCTCPVVEALMCTDLLASSSRAIGDTVTLTCSHSGDNFDHYEYRYKLDDREWIELKGTDNSFEILSSGIYTAQCRVCKTDGTCTTWALAN